MFKFLHTADIHLDSPLLNLDKYDDAPREEFRSATRRAFDNIIDLAIRESVGFVIVAGDLYDGDCTDFHTPRHFRRQMVRLQEHGIRVFVIHGNHDAASNMRKAFRLQLPENVHFFPTNKPGTEVLDDLSVAIHGQGFGKREVATDLSKDYPDPVPGYLNIGVLHTSCGSYEQHDTYAPSTVSGLTNKGYDYWALGHIHKHETLSGPNPWIVYSGNPQGRSVREVGPRGCVIASYDGTRIRTMRHDVDVMRWEHLVVDVAECDDPTAVMNTIHEQLTKTLDQAEGRPLAARLELVGKTQSHAKLIHQADYWDAQIREHVLDLFDEQIWIEKIKFKTTPATIAESITDSALSDLIDSLHHTDLAERALAELRADFDKMLATIPTDPRIRRDEIDLDSSEVVASLIQESQDLLLTRILRTGDDQ